MPHSNYSNRLIIGICITCIGYAVIRYHLFKQVEWAHFPLFILNKGIAFSAVVLLSCSSGFRPLRKYLPGIKSLSGAPFAWSAWLLAWLHLLMSLVLVRSENYPLLFQDGTLNGKGEASLLLGILAFMAMMLTGYFFLKKMMTQVFTEAKQVRLLGYGGLGLLMGHAGIMGAENWLEPAAWPGYMPPVSLLSCLAILLAISLQLLSFFTIKAKPEQVHQVHG
jgi:hypothetical protein